MRWAPWRTSNVQSRRMCRHNRIVNIGSGDTLRCVWCLSGKSLSIYNFSSIKWSNHPPSNSHLLLPLWFRQYAGTSQRKARVIRFNNVRWTMATTSTSAHKREQPCKARRKKRTQSLQSTAYNSLHSMGFSFTTIIKPEFNCVLFFAFYFPFSVLRIVCVCSAFYNLLANFY